MFSEVALDRLPSDRELHRAAMTYPGVDFSEGIGAAFTTTASLLKRMRAGNHACQFEPAGADCPLARPLVETAFAWTNTGTKRALPMSVLTALLHRNTALSPYLDPSHLEVVLGWAAERTAERSALVTPLYRGGQDGNQKLLEGAEIESKSVQILTDAELASMWPASRRPPEAVWNAALAEAVNSGDSESVGRIGFTAHIQRCFRVAEGAWSEVASLEDPAAKWLSRAADFCERGHDAYGNRLALEAVLRIVETTLGPEHPQVAAALTSLGIAWFELGDPALARDLHERAFNINQRTYGPDHVLVAGTMANL